MIGESAMYDLDEIARAKRILETVKGDADDRYIKDVVKFLSMREHFLKGEQDENKS